MTWTADFGSMVNERVPAILLHATVNAGTLNRYFEAIGPFLRYANTHKEGQPTMDSLVADYIQFLYNTHSPK